MRENGIRARPKRRFRRTIDSRHRLPVAANLLQRRFTASGPDEARVGDITYVWTNEGWAYLAVLLDLFSRRVVGWALHKSLKLDLAVAALRNAITRRRPPRGLVHHTDRGCQYASEAYRRLLHLHGAECSISPLSGGTSAPPVGGG
jgi:putative transposase